MISIVLTHFNKGLLLDRTIASLQPNDAIVHEIIVVDDASTDPTWPQHAQALLAQQPKLKIIFNTDNKGPANRLNQGAQQATGDYLFFMDADDVLAPNRLKVFLDEMQRQSADLCYGNKVKIHNLADVHQQVIYSWQSSVEVLYYLLKHNIMEMCVMCRREVFIRSGGCNPRLFIQDESLALSLAQHSQKIIHTEAACVYVILDEAETKRVRGDNRLSRHLEQQHYDMFFTLYDFLQQYPQLPQNCQRLIQRKAISTYWKSKKQQGRANIKDFLLYLVGKEWPAYIWSQRAAAFKAYFTTLTQVRKV